MVTLAAGLSDARRLQTAVAIGETGQVVMDRFDESCFLANVMERDCGERVAADADAGPYDGICAPRPLAGGRLEIDHGIY